MTCRQRLNHIARSIARRIIDKQDLSQRYILRDDFRNQRADVFSLVARRNDDGNE